MWRGQDNRSWVPGRSGGSSSWNQKGSGSGGSGNKSRSDALTWRKDTGTENYEKLKKGEEAEVNSPPKNKKMVDDPPQHDKVRKSLELGVSSAKHAEDMVLDKVEGVQKP